MEGYSVDLHARSTHTHTHACQCLAFWLIRNARYSLEGIFITYALCAYIADVGKTFFISASVAALREQVQLADASFPASLSRQPALAESRHLAFGSQGAAGSSGLDSVVVGRLRSKAS